MKAGIRKLLVRFGQFLTSSVKMKKHHVLVIESSYPSGSNTHALVPYLQEHYSVEILHEKDIYPKMRSVSDALQRLKRLRHISSFPIVITSHGFNKVNPKQRVINLWHGIPLKAMGKMEETPGNKDYHFDDLVMTSKMQAVLMSACTHIEFAKIRILGNPRNDLLLAPSKAHLAQFTAKSSYDKVLFYMPTFRQGFADRVEGTLNADLFNMADIEGEQAFLQFLEKNNYLLVIKLHPQEEHLVLEKFAKLNNPHILILENKFLQEAGIDNYEIMPEVDILLTDYSSIYFDYLLLDRPIVFVAPDLDMYRTSRGFLLEPYEEWTPGYKAMTYNDTIQAIKSSFLEDAYSSERKRLKAIMHSYQDDKSSDRIMKFIESTY